MNAVDPPIEPATARKKNSEGDQDGKRRLRHLELLLEVTRRMASYGTLDQVLQALVEMTTTELNAERGSLFLNDPDTNELYSRVAQGNIQREIRILNSSGIAGYVYTSGEALIIADAYADDRFNRSIDEQTGFQTRNILCVPIKTVKGEVIGVAQTLNKRTGKFTKHDLNLLEAMTSQGTLALQSAQFIERMQAIRRQEMEFIDVVSEVTADIKLGSLLQKVMGEATRLLNAERSTLFLNDEKTSELWSEVGQGLESVQIRLPNHLGIAGAVFTQGKAINIPYAYADLRFNPAFDKKTGYFTRSILCVPIANKHGKVIGVTQVLNKRGGPFTGEDESRLRAFTAQISIALENAKLFADVQNMKNYNEAMLESMSNAVITLDEAEKIATCNAAGLRIFKSTAAQILHKPAAEFFSGSNAWVQEKAEARRRNPDQRTGHGSRIDGRRGKALSQPHRPAPALDGKEAHWLDADAGRHLQREAHALDHVTPDGPWHRRPDAGRRRRYPGRQERAGDGAVLRHPRLHHHHRTARRPGHGGAAQRVLHADGGLHTARGRLPRQVHRRRHHGRLRHPGRPRRRRRPLGAHRDQHDPRALGLEQGPQHRRQAAG
jgi:GAF domain-containing protein